jgi:tetratricopeptide (TPR) repeat protein
MTRHELKTQDEITTTLQNFTERALAYQKQIIAAVAVVVVAGLALIGWNIYAGSRDASAQAMLSAAILAYNDTAATPDAKARYEKTIAEAQKAYDAYPSLPAGIIAQYYMALGYEGLGDLPRATETLQQVIDRGDESIRGVARFALGGIHKKRGEFAKAIEVYTPLYNDGGYSKAAVGFELAQLHEANNQPDQAKEYYQKVTTEFPQSPFRAASDEALSRLGVVATPAATQ